MDLVARVGLLRQGRLTVAVTQVCAIDHVATLPGEDPETLGAIAGNDDNLSHGTIVSVHTGPDEAISALTGDGIDKREPCSPTQGGPPMTGGTSSKASWKTRGSSHASRKKEPR